MNIENIRSSIFLFIVFAITGLSCNQDEVIITNPVIGHTYVISDIIMKSEIKGYIFENGNSRMLNDEEIIFYGDFSFTDNNDANFIGNQIEFISNDTVLYGPNGFQSPFIYNFTDEIIDVELGNEISTSGIEELNQIFFIQSNDELNRDVFHHRRGSNSGTVGTDGEQYSEDSIDQIISSLSVEGETFVYQSMVFIYQRTN